MKLAASCLEYVDYQLNLELTDYTVLDDHYVNQLLAQIAKSGIKPSGRLLLSKSQVGPTTAGTCRPLTGSVVVTAAPAGSVSKTDPFVAVHEVAHSSARGDMDHFALLVRSGSTIELHGLTELETGWLFRDRFDLRYDGGPPRFEDRLDQYRGFWFEEATAELVELSVATHENDPKYPRPVTFSHSGTTFELPTEFGHLVAGWGALMLEKYCPGLLRVLWDGARGNADRAALKQVIDGRFPGLFDAIDSSSGSSQNLAAGTVAIMRRVGLA